MDYTAKPDLPVRRFVPDPTLVARAHNLMLECEDERHRFLRQRWEEAYAATRVALAALREIYPAEADQCEDDDLCSLAAASHGLDIAYTNLDRLSEGILGWQMVGVLRGAIATHDEFAATE